MSRGACSCAKGARRWVVSMRKHNRSAFNGYRRTPSDYSQVWCLACFTTWRSKGAYVDELPDARPGEIRPPAHQRGDG